MLAFSSNLHNGEHTQPITANYAAGMNQQKCDAGGRLTGAGAQRAKWN